MFTLEFTHPECRDVRQVGGKAASLAEMTAPRAARRTGLCRHGGRLPQRTWRKPDSRSSPRRSWTGSRPDSGQAEFDEAERVIAARLAGIPLPEELAAPVREAYAKLCADCGVDDVAVAVRSSATAEDSVGASFAGEFETWVDITGAEEVLAHIHKCYVSVFAGRVLSYLAEKEIDPHAIEMAVVVQKMVRARAAGVMFTLSPTSGDRSKIVLEASWGLGLSVVGGEVTPDRFMVEKIGLDIADRTPGYKHIEYRRGDAPAGRPGGTPFACSAWRMRRSRRWRLSASSWRRSIGHRRTSSSPSTRSCRRERTWSCSSAGRKPSGPTRSVSRPSTIRPA